MQPSRPVTGLGRPEAAAVSDAMYRLLRSIVLSPQADHFGLIEENDLTVSQVRTLMTLACADPEPMSGSRLAERLGVSAPAMSRALDVLVQKGFAIRAESATDRRVRNLTITSAGRELADGLTALRRAQIDRFLDGLSPAQVELLGTALREIDPGGPLGDAAAEQAGNVGHP